MTPYEKMKRLIDLVESGVKPVIKWIDCGTPINEFDTYDVGMMCRVEGITDKDDLSDDNCIVFRVNTDFSEFEDFNKSVAKPTWFDDNNNPTLKWHETKAYPKNKKDWIYMQIAKDVNDPKAYSSGDMFDFVQDTRLTLYAQYESEGSKDDYMTWLENQVIKS